MKVIIVGGRKVMEDRLLRGRNVHVKFNTCGRKNCACRLGLRHGPYYYVRRKVGNNRYKDVYVKPPEESSLPFDYRILEADILADIEDKDQIPKLFGDCIVFEVSRRVR